jgi:hypothetical protein
MLGLVNFLPKKIPFAAQWQNILQKQKIICGPAGKSAG